MDSLKFPLAGVCLLLIVFLLVPTVSAIVENIEIPPCLDPNERDRPENIAALKYHDALIGEAQEARMKGVISYIDRISAGEGVEGLRQIKQDYLAAAGSIPAVNTADEINELREEMRVLSSRFEDEAKGRRILYNGTTEGMEESINISLVAFDLALNGMTQPLWLSQAGARLVVFDRDSQERNYTLRSLAGRGIDISLAQKISTRIDAQRPALSAAVQDSRSRAMFAANTEIKSMNQQFRNLIAEYRAKIRTSP